MPVSSVKFQSDAICSCLNHALSTEKEEIMGLLIGSVSFNIKPKLVLSLALLRIKSLNLLITIISIYLH